MKVIEEDQDSITAYCTADELIDDDKVCGMVFDEGVPMYLVQRRRDDVKPVLHNEGRRGASA